MLITNPTSELLGEKTTLFRQISRTINYFNICYECKVCCCQNARPPLTTNRVRKINAYLAKRSVHMVHPFGNAEYTFAAVDDLGFCVFYNTKTKQCRIHDVKPESCIAGPVTFDINLQTRKLEWFLKTAEACSLAGEMHNNPDQLNAHFKIARLQILKLINNLETGQLRAILKIAEPQTFKFAEEVLPNHIAKILGKQ